jgi:hypothetical protein
MSWDLQPCPIVPMLGWCKSNAGCPITLRYYNAGRKTWEKAAPDCIYLREQHPGIGEPVPGAQLKLITET